MSKQNDIQNQSTYTDILIEIHNARNLENVDNNWVNDLFDVHEPVVQPSDTTEVAEQKDVFAWIWDLQQASLQQNNDIEAAPNQEHATAQRVHSPQTGTPPSSPVTSSSTTAPSTPQQTRGTPVAPWAPAGGRTFLADDSDDEGMQEDSTSLNVATSLPRPGHS